MEFKGTKGGWKIENKTLNTTVIYSDGVYGEIARVFSENAIDREQMKANAKLISCAPEMLEMLDRVLKIYGRGYEPKENAEDTVGSILYKEIEQLIQKATTL